jgi:hypothetical protein
MGDALTTGRAWKTLDTLLSDAQVAFAGEPAALERYWRATADATPNGTELLD